MAGASKNVIQRKMFKKLVTHGKDEDMYKRHLFVFKKAFPNFIYNNFLDSLELLSPSKEVDGAEYSGTTCQQ